MNRRGQGKNSFWITPKVCGAWHPDLGIPQLFHPSGKTFKTFKRQFVLKLKDICLIEIDIPGALFGAEVQKDIPRRCLQVHFLYKIRNRYIGTPLTEITRMYYFAGPLNMISRLPKFKRWAHPKSYKNAQILQKNNCPYSIKYLQITKRFAGSTEWATVRFWRMRWIEAPAPVIWGAPWGTTSTPCCVNFAHFQISLSWFNCVFSGISVQSPNTCNSFDFL